MVGIIHRNSKAKELYCYSATSWSVIIQAKEIMRIQITTDEIMISLETPSNGRGFFVVSVVIVDKDPHGPLCADERSKKSPT